MKNDQPQNQEYSNPLPPSLTPPSNYFHVPSPVHAELIKEFSEEEDGGTTIDGASSSRQASVTPTPGALAAAANAMHHSPFIPATASKRARRADSMSSLHSSILDDYSASVSDNEGGMHQPTPLLGSTLASPLVNSHELLPQIVLTDEIADMVAIEEADRLLCGDGLESATVKEVQNAINVSHPFGIKLWKPALYKKSRSIHTLTQLEMVSDPSAPSSLTLLNLGNLLWALIFGWWMSLLYLSISLLMLSLPLIGLLVGAIDRALCHCSSSSRRNGITASSKNSFLMSISLDLIHAFDYAKLMLSLSTYVLWPFGKVVERSKALVEELPHSSATQETTALLNPRHSFTRERSNSNQATLSRSRSRSANDSFNQGPSQNILPNHHTHQRPTPNLEMRAESVLSDSDSWSEDFDNMATDHRRVHSSKSNHYDWVVRQVKKAGFSGCLFQLLFLLILIPAHLLSTGICFFFVISVPMAKWNFILAKSLIKYPLRLSIQSQPIQRTNSHKKVIVCLNNATGLRYYKYTFDGVNIVLVNLNVLVIFTLVDFYYLAQKLDHKGIGSSGFIFLSALISVIPLAYLIGMSVSSITAQTGSLALGAVVNATFGSIVEILLYCLALMQGKTRMVEGSIIGSLMAGLLALPGVAMFAGGLKRKEQRFNQKAAGVTSTLLILSLIGAFGPTLFHETYGSFELHCSECPTTRESTAGTLVAVCKHCRHYQPHPTSDPVYLNYTRPLMYVCSASLLLIYAIGLLFTLRTHAKRIYPDARKDSANPESVFSMVSPSPLNNPESTAPKPQIRGRPIRTTERNVLPNQTRERTLRPHSMFASLSPKSPAKTLAQTLHGTDSTSPTAGLGILDPSDATPQARHWNSNIAQFHGAQFPRERTATQESSIRFRSRDRSVSASIGGTSTGTADDNDDDGGVVGGHLPRNFAFRTQPVRSRYQADSIISSPSSVAFNPHHGAVEFAQRTPQLNQNHQAYESRHSVGHEHPNWSASKSAVILLGATVLFSLIAEILIATVDHVIETTSVHASGDSIGKGGIAIDEKFLGLTLFALVPTVTEFYNAIAFAQTGNIALALEIGSAYAVQVALLQIPVLVAFSTYWRKAMESSPSPPQMLENEATTSHPFFLWKKMFLPLLQNAASHESLLHLPRDTFTLVFPRWDLIAVIFSVFTVTYIYIEGKSTYFKGSMLLLAYLMLMTAFFFSPPKVEV